MASKHFGPEWVNQSVSTATMRAEDLIPSFLSALETVSKAEASRIRGRYHYRTTPIVHSGWESHPAWFDKEETAENDSAHWMLEDLFDALDRRAPAGCSFGASEGDGADYGFWSYDGEEEEESDDEPIVPAECKRAAV